MKLKPTTSKICLTLVSLCWNPHRWPGSQNCVSVWDGLQQRAPIACSAVLLLFQCVSSRSLVEKCSVLISKHGGKQRVSSDTNAGWHLQRHLPLSAAHLLPPSPSLFLSPDCRQAFWGLASCFSYDFWFDFINIQQISGPLKLKKTAPRNTFSFLHHGFAILSRYLG